MCDVDSCFITYNIPGLVTGDNDKSFISLLSLYVLWPESMLTLKLSLKISDVQVKSSYRPNSFPTLKRKT